MKNSKHNVPIERQRVQRAQKYIYPHKQMHAWQGKQLYLSPRHPPPPSTVTASQARKERDRRDI